MRQSLSLEDSGRSLSTCAVKFALGNGATESPLNLDVHILKQFAVLIKHVNLSIWSQRVHFGLINRDSNEYLELDSSRVSGLRLHDLVATLSSHEIRLAGLLVEVPVFQMLIASCYKEILATWKCQTDCRFAQLVSSHNSFVLPVPEKQSFIIGVSESD